jgi:hypothetical protein
MERIITDRKWLPVSEEIAFKKVIICTESTGLRNGGKLSYRMRGKEEYFPRRLTSVVNKQ